MNFSIGDPTLFDCEFSESRLIPTRQPTVPIVISCVGRPPCGLAPCGDARPRLIMPARSCVASMRATNA